MILKVVFHLPPGLTTPGGQSDSLQGGSVHVKVCSIQKAKRELTNLHQARDCSNFIYILK